MPIDWTKSKYSKKHRMFLSKKPEDMAFFTLCDGAVRSAKTLSIIYKIPQIFDYRYVFYPVQNFCNTGSIDFSKI